MNFSNSLQIPTTETHQLLKFTADEDFIARLESLPLEGNERWCEYVDRDAGWRLRCYTPDLIVTGETVYCSIQTHLSPRGRGETRINLSITTSPERLRQFVTAAPREVLALIPAFADTHHP